MVYINYMVTVADPYTLTSNKSYQCRNVRLIVSKQAATILMELYDSLMPVEQFSSNIFVPVQSKHTIDYREPEEPGGENVDDMVQWYNDLRNNMYSTSTTVKTLNGDYNYVVGIPLTAIRK